MLLLRKAFEYRMAQQSITSFFKRVAAKDDETIEADRQTKRQKTDASSTVNFVKNVESKLPSPKKTPSPSPKKTASSKQSSPKKTPPKDKTPPNDKAKTTEQASTSESTDQLKLVNMKADSLEYNPAKSKYDPIKDACWNQNEKVPYFVLARTFQIIEDTGSRLKMVEVLANFLRSVIVLSKADLIRCIYLSLNQLAPAYEGIELGVAETGLLKAIAQSTGRTLAQVKADVQAMGDLGIVAEQSKSKQRTMFKPKPLTVEVVFDKLETIAKMSGQASMAKKIDMIQSLLVACQQIEARFLIRSLAGKLRIGIAEQSLLQALAQACAMTVPNITKYDKKDLNQLAGYSEPSIKTKIDEVAFKIKSAYSRCPNYEKIVTVLLDTGVDSLEEKCKVTPGVPLKPMLALPTKGVGEIFERFDGVEFTCEWKYDGERAQIHHDDKGNTFIYSRNSENNTGKYPDIIQRINLMKKNNLTSFIVDAEVVAWDVENKKILPFQILTTRKRKDVSENEIKIQVCVFMFDLLYLNGTSLVEKPFAERRDLLYNNFTTVEGQWMFAIKMDTHDMEEVQVFLENAVKGNCEGLMVKTLKKDASYEIAKRSKNWLKLKKDYLDSMGDTLDLVVVGGYFGKGKRHGNYGGFLLACYDPDNEEYQTICKLGTGFSDEDLKTLSALLSQHVIKTPKHYYRFDSSTAPDEWFEPVKVMEIKCADLSISPIYKAALGIVDPEKGISLRFPRFIRVRDDKNIEDATSAQQIGEMYYNQAQVKNQNEPEPMDDE